MLLLILLGDLHTLSTYYHYINYSYPKIYTLYSECDLHNSQFISNYSKPFSIGRTSLTTKCIKVTDWSSSPNKVEINSLNSSALL